MVPDRPLKIAIDARELTSNKPGGYRSYVAGLITGLAEVDSANEYILYVDDDTLPESIRLPRKSHVQVVRGNRILLDLLKLPRQIKTDAPDLVHFPCNYGLPGLDIPYLITVHDCFFLEERFALRAFKRQVLNRYTAIMARSSVRQARVVLTVSNYSRNEIVCRLKPFAEVVVIYPGCSPAHMRGGTDAEQIAGTEPDKPYVLFFGSVDPRKNSSIVVKAFARTQAARGACKLVSVCASAASVVEMVRLAREYGLVSNLETLANVSDSDLRKLYRWAITFIFPSLKEGFGLPLVEAMSHGCPVIASNVTAIPEVLGDAALYFDPRDADDLAQKIDLVWHNKDMREDLARRGLEHSARYNWRSAARGVLSVYERVASNL
ncbi:MAG: glycosyltransferase family 4 protein [Armatimonadota bacterium]